MSLDAWLRDRARQRDDAGLRRALRPRSAGDCVIDLAGNDYLGLGRDPRLVSAASVAAETWGAGSGASRLVTGTTELHAELETSLAAFTGRPAALVFSSGYLANLGAVTSLSESDTLIVSDQHVHASLIDACRLARRSRVAVVPHNDVAAADQALRDRAEPRALVLCESVYSVVGDAAPLAELVELTRRRDAVLVVDEAHAIGVAGPGGRGLLASFEPTSLAHVVGTVTLSKALGSQGGAVLGTPAVIDQLVNTARSFIYDTGLAPAAVGAALAALDVVRMQPDLPSRALRIAHRLSDALGAPTPAGAVLSLPMPSPHAALDAQRRLRERGFLVGCFRPPSVPDGVSRLRLTAKADLRDADAERLVSMLSPLVAAR